MSVSDIPTNSLRIIKKNGDIVEFNAEKISVAIGKAFLAVEGQHPRENLTTHCRSYNLYNTFKNIREFSICEIIHILSQRQKRKKTKTLFSFSIKNLIKAQSFKISSIFETQKTIFLPLCFREIRKISIHKNLSISA